MFLWQIFSVVARPLSPPPLLVARPLKNFFAVSLSQWTYIDTNFISEDFVSSICSIEVLIKYYIIFGKYIHLDLTM